MSDPAPYEAAYAHPDGDATASRLARAAREYGYDGLVIRTREAEFDPGALRERYDVDVVPAVEVVADEPASASGAVGNFRPEYPLVLVRGGTDALNRFAVEQDRVDVLAAPLSGDGGFNHVLAKAAVEHGTRIEFDLGPALRASGGERVRALKGLRKLREIVAHYDAPYVVSARPASHLELRAVREVVALGSELGFDEGWIRRGLAEWGRIVARNRERRSAGFISPGVRVDECEEADR
ncbi:ribonuclease P [Halobaculum sp. CBA1158]|uniref:RNase P subunit p30 family protein n=1 Tax=Halobaculum sp. CBA1158 TaxID=2904243 RepID=UPI001F3D1670|nr:RNase P subunit p30 family protein [Halobaculum sp. CBA1158]UIO98437.1 ribonuclease P [Halobaculum sp. CBA1158]